MAEERTTVVEGGDWGRRDGKGAVNASERVICCRTCGG